MTLKKRLEKLEAAAQPARPAAVTFWVSTQTYSVNQDEFTRDEFIARFGCDPDPLVRHSMGAPLRFDDL